MYVQTNPLGRTRGAVEGKPLSYLSYLEGYTGLEAGVAFQGKKVGKLEKRGQWEFESHDVVLPTGWSFFPCSYPKWP